MLTFAYFKTHTFHWNVKGINFYSLHKLFEEQYLSLFGSIDEIAERIRYLGSLAPSSYSQFQALSTVKEAQGVPDAKGMISALANDQEIIIRNVRKWIVELTDINDSVTADFLTTRLSDHEKMGWMLKAHLE